MQAVSKWQQLIEDEAYVCQLMFTKQYQHFEQVPPQRLVLDAQK